MLFFIFEEITKENGISKKILSQVESLKSFKPNIELIKYKIENNYICRCVHGKNIFFEKVLKNKICKQFLSYKYSKILNYIEKQQIKIIYIRYSHIANPFFLNFLRKLKNLNIKILLEIPTYPYDGEKINEVGLRKIKCLIEKKYRDKMYKYIDRIVTFSENEEIFKIKTIQISNGINLNNIKMKEKIKKNLDEISFVGVAGLAFYHGFDRFIRSMAEYYKKEKNPQKIKFHIVGEGDIKVLNELKKIVKEEKLEKEVIFYGKQFGDSLDKIYNISDIGVGSLGRHRSGIDTMRALKNREYCAVGLPMIFSEDDPDLREAFFAYHISKNEDLIDIARIVEWYKNLNYTPEKIREYSERFSWDIQMKKVVDEIQKIGKED